MRIRSELRVGACVCLLAMGCGEVAGTGATDADAQAEVTQDDVAQDAAPDEVTPARPDYPLDDTLRVNHIQALGTHNSYHVRADEETIPPWDYTQAPLDVQLGAQGVRQVELDIHYKGPGELPVYHLPLLDSASNCPDLATCLGLVRQWSDAHPGHHLLWVLIEPKDEVDSLKFASHYLEVDAALRAVWPVERVLRPDDLRGTRGSIRERLTLDGWPTLGETRDKVMFVMLDEGENQEAYLATFRDLVDAMIFMRGGRGEPWGCVLEFNDPVGQAGDIATALAEGYLVRSSTGDADSTPEELAAHATAALAAGATFISTDFPDGTPDAPWTFAIPGGQPSRCNPVTAPAQCKSSDIEALPDR